MEIIVYLYQIKEKIIYFVKKLCRKEEQLKY